MNPTDEDAESVAVPPSHKVVVFRATPESYLFRSDSGFWIVQLGDQGDHTGVFEQLKDLLAQKQQENLIWIVQPDNLVADLLARISSIVRPSVDCASHIAVLPGVLPDHSDVVKQLRELGMNVHDSADDGACFVEVHRPDGVAVGLPGPPVRSQ